jgi:predicted nucleotidyltransferase
LIYNELSCVIAAFDVKTCKTYNVSMDQIPYRVTLIIKRFIDELEKNNIPIKEAILFGSYAKGNYHDWSDVDLALVSDAFEGERFHDRNMIRRIKLEISLDLEPLPYRPEDFTSDDPFVQKIIETGMRVV